MHEQPFYQYFEDINLGLLRMWGGRRGLRVLDVGCGFATTSAKIQQLGNDVTGIDQDSTVSDVASQRLSRLIRADLARVDDVAAQLGDETFDVLIFADVLEHLPQPLPILKAYLRWLKEGGSVIISLPNVGLWSVRFAHLFGRWEYQETGVLDHTHLRFFTRKSARRIIAEAGLRPVKTTYNPGILRPLVPMAKKVLARHESQAGAVHDPAALINSPYHRFYRAAVHPVERAIASLWPGMLAFQMIFETKRAS